MPPKPTERSRLKVVLFSGGRGSGALTEQLATNARITLTIVINGYDDGASTGEVRRFLGDCLGPSDFRKNASRLARLLRTCPEPLIDLLDLRLDPGLVERTIGERAARAVGGGDPDRDPRLDPLRAKADLLAPELRQAVASRLQRFAEELASSPVPFDFADCSVGNLVFAGGFLLEGRAFNAAVDGYCQLVGLAPGLVDNVTDGTNAFLVAIDADGRVLGSEEAIVDGNRSKRIEDIFLIAAAPTAEDVVSWSGASREELARRLAERSAPLRLHSRVARAVHDADLIVYAPGTQHSSLFPSYLTPGLSRAVAGNLTAIKLLITNIQTDAEITGSSAVDIVDRAMFYMKEKGRFAIATPCLMTHYLLNDPGSAASTAPYVPLGRLESLEDPRLVRVANYEEGMTGRHDATKILGPFIDAFVARRNTRQKVAVLLYESSTTTKVVQSLLEMVRAGIRDLPVDLAVFHDGPGDVEPELVSDLGFPVQRLEGDAVRRDAECRAALERGKFDYVILFESSGMYNGEDVASLASHLNLGRLDAVWGSRRLSVKDIHASYRLRYRERSVLGAISYAGSHALSLMYLALYGRYVSDTLSAARAVRVRDAMRLPGLLTDKLTNQHILSALLRREAEMFEVPVQFFAISPHQVKRTSPWDGLVAIATVLRARFRRLDPLPVATGAAIKDVRTEPTTQAR